MRTLIGSAVLVVAALSSGCATILTYDALVPEWPPCGPVGDPTHVALLLTSGDRVLELQLRAPCRGGAAFFHARQLGLFERRDVARPTRDPGALARSAFPIVVADRPAPAAGDLVRRVAPDGTVGPRVPLDEGEAATSAVLHVEPSDPSTSAWPAPTRVRVRLPSRPPPGARRHEHGVRFVFALAGPDALAPEDRDRLKGTLEAGRVFFVFLAPFTFAIDLATSPLALIALPFVRLARAP